MSIARERIVVFGATGVFGALIAEDLLAHTDAPLVLAARNPAACDVLARQHPSRIRLLAADVNDPAAVREVLRGAAACVLAVGPFQGVSTAALEACCDLGVPYLDINDAREYSRAVHALDERIRQAGIPVMTGLSTVPGLSSLCVAHVTRLLDGSPGPRTSPPLPPAVDAVHIALLIGNRNRKGPGAAGSLLATLGRPFNAVEDGRPVRRRVWGGCGAVRFLPPVGMRVVRDADSPDYDLLPRRFGARTVRFQVGFDINASARGMEALALLHRVTGLSLLRVTGPLLALSRFTAGGGTEIGALRVEVKVSGPRSSVPDPGSGTGGLGPGTGGRRQRTTVVQVTSFTRGQRVAAIPAAVGARYLWEGKITRAGILPMYEWIAPEDFFAELRERGFQVNVGKQ